MMDLQKIWGSSVSYLCHFELLRTFKSRVWWVLICQYLTAYRPSFCLQGFYSLIDRKVCFYLICLHFWSFFDLHYDLCSRLIQLLFASMSHCHSLTGCWLHPIPSKECSKSCIFRSNPPAFILFSAQKLISIPTIAQGP